MSLYAAACNAGEEGFGKSLEMAGVSGGYGSGFVRKC
jgi:hypothetical protein